MTSRGKKEDCKDHRAWKKVCKFARSRSPDPRDREPGKNLSLWWGLVLIKMGGVKREPSAKMMPQWSQLKVISREQVWLNKVWVTDVT